VIIGFLLSADWRFFYIKPQMRVLQKRKKRQQGRKTLLALYKNYILLAIPKG